MLASQELSDEVVLLQDRLSDIQERLSYWTNVDSVNDADVLTRMEDSLKESLQHIQRQKEKTANQHFVKLESNNQLQNDLELPFHVNNEEPQLQDLSTWIPFDDMQQMGVPEDLNLPSQRSAAGCFTGQTFSGPFGYLNMCGREDALIPVQPSQENGFGANPSQHFPLAFGGQYPYPYNLNMMGDEKGFQHLLGMDMKANCVDYDFEVKCQTPSGSARNDASTSHVLPMSCCDSLFGEHLNSQNGTQIPSPTAQSIYKTVVNDPSRMLYDLLNAPN